MSQEFNSIPADIKIGDCFEQDGPFPRNLIYVGKANRETLPIYSSFFNKIDKNHDLYMESDTIDSFPYVFVSHSHEILYYYNFNKSFEVPGKDTVGPFRRLQERPTTLVKICEEIIAKLKTKSKRFVLFKPSRSLWCVDGDNVFTKYANENDRRGPLGKKIERLELYEDIDISFSAYLTLTGLTLLSKEDELKTIKQEMFDLLGCQKDSLSPLLESFLKFVVEFNEHKFGERKYKEESVGIVTEVLVKLAGGRCEISGVNPRVSKMKDSILEYLKKLDEK